MDKQKEQYLKAVSLIKQEKYKEALDYLDVLLLKDQKNIEYNMCSGLCFQKLGNFKKAEEFYEYTLEKRPEDPKILNALFKLNKDDLKNKERAMQIVQKLITIYKKSDMTKAMDATVGLCEILNENQERKQLDQYFMELLKFGTAEQAYKVAKFYIPLIVNLKLLDPTKPKASNQIIQLSKKLQNQPPNPEIMEAIMRNNIGKFPVEFRETLFGLAISKDHYMALYDWLELFPQSCFLLDQVLRYCHCFLDHNIKFLLEQCIILLSDNYDGLLFQNYKQYDEELYQKTVIKAQSFLAFMRIYGSQIVQTSGEQFLAAIDKLIQQKNFDVIEKEKDYTIFELPLKVNQLFKSDNQDHKKMANTLMTEFNKKMKQLKNLDYDVSVLEEVGANLGYDILADPIELMEMKNLLKIRIKNKAYSLETYEKYFDYQMKLVQMVRHYDEELSMELIFEKILQDDPSNLKIKINYDWLKFSEKKISQKELIERYNNYLPAPPKIEQTIFKRLGTLNLLSKNFQEAKQYFSKVQVDDYEVGVSLGIIAFYQKQYAQSLEHLYRAFNYCQTNYHLNQIIMFVLTKLKQKDRALEFAMNIYKLHQFQNIYWLSFTLGQHLMQNLQFNNAHDMLQKAADQFHFNVEKTYKLYYEKKFDLQDFSIPYLINQNDNVYLSDYPIFSSQYLVDQGMIILTEQYFLDEKYLKLFKLEMKLAELKKILGLQGSALKSLEKAEELLQGSSGVKIKTLDKYLEQKLELTDNKSRLILFAQKLNEIQVQTKWVSTYKTKQIDLQYSKLLILHNFESAQLHLYGQQEYFSQERMIQGILMAIHNFEEQEVQILIKSYSSFVFEIASQQIKNQLSYGSDGVRMLSMKYLTLFELISPLLQLNVYANECLREFFYLLGIYCDINYFKDALKYANNVIQQLCQIDISDKFDVQETFQHMRSVLTGQDKKILIVKNNILSILLTRQRLNLESSAHLQLSLSLFPKCDVLYCIGAQIRKNPSYILRALEYNPKCQQALYQLGLIYIGRSNYDFAFQTFQKCIEVEPTTSAFAYLGLTIILLIYIQQNNNIELPKANEIKQLEVLQGYQNQLSQAIASYLDYVSTLQNTPIQNIMSIIYRNLYMGYTVTCETILYDEKFKQIIQQFPTEFANVLQCELPYLKPNEETEKIYSKYATFESIKQEIEITITQMKSFEAINNNHISWAMKLKYLLHLGTLVIDKVNSLKELVLITNLIFDSLTQQLIQLKHATNQYNFDVLFLSFVNKWYHYTRTAYLKDNSQKEYYLYVAKFQSECFKLKDQNEAQLINYIDVLVGKQNKITEELQQKLQFMEKIYHGNWREALNHLQLCILYNPSNFTYRSVLSKLKLTLSAQHQVQSQLLNLTKANQAIPWLNTVINELAVDRARSTSRLPLILKIIKYKILPYADELIAKQVIKVLCDVEQQISTEGLLEQVSKKYNINYEKYMLQSTIQKYLNEKKDAQKLIQKYKVQYLDTHEEPIQSKKIAMFLIPIITQLFYDRGSKNMEDLLSSALQYSKYAQQELLKDDKLKKARFIYNCLYYTTYLKKLNDLDQIGETLIVLQDISTEFSNQGMYNQISQCLFIHYHVAVEKYDELDEWLNVTSQYKNLDNEIKTWGSLVMMFKKVKDITTLKNFIKFTQDANFTNPKLQSMIYYLIGSAMMNVADWQLKYSKEEVLKKFQLSLLLNPNKEVVKQLQPLQTTRQVKQKLKLKLDQYFVDVQTKKKVSKKLTEGLNSDSDEMLVDQMDFDDEQKEFEDTHGIAPEFQQQVIEQPNWQQQGEYTAEQYLAWQQQQIAEQTPEYLAWQQQQTPEYIAWQQQQTPEYIAWQQQQLTQYGQPDESQGPEYLAWQQQQMEQYQYEGYYENGQEEPNQGT